MNIVTDPLLRGDQLWLALERARTAIEDDTSILFTKEPAYEEILLNLVFWRVEKRRRILLVI
jgi:hypothetical protein